MKRLAKFSGQNVTIETGSIHEFSTFFTQEIPWISDLHLFVIDLIGQSESRRSKSWISTDFFRKARFAQDFNVWLEVTSLWKVKNEKG